LLLKLYLMKNILLVIVICLLASCKSQNLEFKPSHNFSLSSVCLEDGDCDLEVKDGFEYTLNEDDGGMLYPTYTEKENSKVLVFTYEKEKDPNLADDFYRENVVFTIPYNLKKGSYKDSDLAMFNINFGRFCFCRGVAGYYPITTGTLIVTDNEIDLVFDVDSGPQKIKHITITF